jgi:hypothetical protein
MLLLCAGQPRAAGADILNPPRVAAIADRPGCLALVDGGFTHTSETHEATLGPLSVAVDGKERVKVPVWAGAGAMVIGDLPFLFGTKRK